MISIHDKPQMDSLVVEFVTKQTLKNHELYTTCQLMNFEGDYQKECLLPDKKTLLIGTTQESKTRVNDDYFNIDIFEIGGHISRVIRETAFTSLYIKEFQSLIDLTQRSPQEVLDDLYLGLYQGRWDFDVYKKDKVKELKVTFGDGTVSEQAHITARELVEVRRIVEEAPESINPQSLEEYMVRECKENPQVDITVMKEDELLEKGLNGLVSVGRASRYEPRLIHAVYKPKSTVKKRICLVGKGVTYDSGGLDIKISGHMREMKSDMGGAATMYGVFKTISELKPEFVEVHYITGLVENMIASNSYKPDDIYTSYSGLTVEVENTDAEGRITLADLLTYATEQQPDHIIDAATLTGASIVALTYHNGTLLGNDGDLCNQLETAFRSRHERLYEQPFSEVLRGSLKGSKSDLINLPKSRYGGHITAGIFLSHFVEPSLFRNDQLETHGRKEGYSWAHIDLAGPAFNKEENPLKYNGATGYGVRSLVSWILGFSN